MDRCPLCFGPFRKPKLLPCLDTLCFTCLDDLVLKTARASGSFPCPVCKLEIAVPEGGVAKFDDNQFIKLEQSLEKKGLNLEQKAPCEVGVYASRYYCNSVRLL